LGVEVTECLIFEDATVGIQAAEAAGSGLVIITSTHDHPIQTSHATLADYTSAEVRTNADGRVQLHSI
jgi:sugar-phosphatase